MVADRQKKCNQIFISTTTENAKYNLREKKHHHNNASL
jgi:hypothetical protein